MHASFRRDEEGKLLLCLVQWGRMVVHIFDQGKAFAFWLGLLLAFHLRFVLSFRKDYQLLDAQGNRRKTWRIAMGKRDWSERTMWDSRRAQWDRASVLALPVHHSEHPESPLWLVVCREPRANPLVSVDRGAHQHRRRRLARGVCLYAQVANRTDLAL